MIPQWFKTFQQGYQHCKQRQRVALYLDCTWQSEWGSQRSRISSLSPTGCYIEDRFTVPPIGETVPELTMTLATGPVSLQGRVLDAMPGIGFAVRFLGVDDDTRDRLTAHVQGFRQLHPQH